MQSETILSFSLFQACYFITALAFSSSLICYYFSRKEKRILQLVTVLSTMQKDLLNLDARLISCKFSTFRQFTPADDRLCSALDNAEQLWTDLHGFICESEAAISQSGTRRIEPLINYLEQVLVPEDDQDSVLESWRQRMDINLKIIERMILEQHQSMKYNA